MKKYLTIVLGILLALLCTTFCGKPDGDSEEVPGAGDYYECLDNETGIDWKIAFFEDGCFTIKGETSKDAVEETGTYTQLGHNSFFLRNKVVQIPTNMSPSGQVEYHRFERADFKDQAILVSCYSKIGDGNWSDPKRLTFK